MAEGKTRYRLADELRKVAARSQPANASKYEAFAKRAETGELTGYLGTLVDIDARKRMEEALRASERQHPERDGEEDEGEEVRAAGPAPHEG